MLSRKFILARDQIFTLVLRDFKLKYNSTVLGFMWSLLVPIFTSLVYCVVFKFLIRWSLPNYVLYLLSGNFLWYFFGNVVTSSGRILLSNAALLKKTSFNRSFLIFGVFSTETIHFLLTIPILAFLMWLFGVCPQFSTMFINIAVVFVLTALLSMGIGFLYAALNLFFRDLERIIGLLMMAWMFMSPVFVPITLIPDEYLHLYYLNPMAGILSTWRDAFYVPGFHPERFPYLFAVCITVFLLGYFIFRKLEPQFAEKM